MQRRTAVRRRARARLVAPLAACTVATVACTFGSDEQVLPGTDEAIVVDEIVALDAAPTAVWGFGRAVLARPVDDGVTAVVTTTGVFLAGDDVVQLDAFTGPTQVARAALSDDGSTLAIASASPAIVRWYDLAGQRVIGADQLPVGVDIDQLDFLPGTTVLAATTITGLYTWPAGPLGGVATPLGDAVASGRAGLLPDGRIAVPVATSDEIAVVGTESVTRRAIDLADGAVVWDVATSPDGTAFAVSAGAGVDAFEREDRIELRDPTTFEPVATIDIGRPLLAPNWVVTDSGVAVSDGSSVTFWTPSGDLAWTAASPTEEPIVQLHAVGDDVVSVHRSGAIVSWPDGGDASDPSLVDEGGTQIEDLAVHPARAGVLTVDFFGRIAAHELSGDAPAVTDDRFAVGAATGVAIGDGERVAVATTAGSVALLEPDLAESATLAVADGPVRVDTVEFNPATGRLSTGLAERLGDLAFDDTVTTWDGGEGDPLYTIGGESEDVAGCAFFFNRVRFTSDGALMAVTSHDFTVALFDASSGELVHRFDPMPSTVLDIAFSFDDRYLVATSETATVTVWDVAERTVAGTYDAALGGYQAIAPMPSDPVMATVDVTGTLALVDMLTGETYLTFDGTASRTTSIALSSDGSMLAAPSGFSEVSIWSTDSGLRLAELDGHAAAVTDLAFAADSTWLVTVSIDGTARRWSLEATT